MSTAACWNCRQPLADPTRCTVCGAVQAPAGPPSAAPTPLPGVPVQRPASAQAPLPPAPATRASREAGTRSAEGDLGPAFRGRAAGTGARLAAFTIDVVVVAAAAAVALVVSRSVVLAAVVGAEAVGALLLWEAHTGLTVGNALLRLRTARVDRPFSPGAGPQTARAVVLGLGALAAVVGAWVVVASAAWDASGRRRTWADRVAGTVVVAVPRRERTVREVPAVAPSLTVAAPAQPLVMMRAPAPVAAAPAPGPVVPAVPPAVPHAAVAAPAPAPARAAAPAAAAPPAPRPASQPAPQPAAQPAAQPAPQAAAAQVTALLVFDTGQRAFVPLGASAVLGRAPGPVDPHDLLLAVHDGEGTVSKSHLRLEHGRDGVWLTDLGSTNGTHLVDEDGTTRLPQGTRVVLGDGVRVRVGRRAFTVSVVVQEG